MKAALAFRAGFFFVLLVVDFFVLLAVDFLVLLVADFLVVLGIESPWMTLAASARTASHESGGNRTVVGWLSTLPTPQLR
jgi:hypothetical protein